MIGRHLVTAARDYEVTILTRGSGSLVPSGAKPLPWDPQAARNGDVAELERVASVLEGAYAVVNLAGASIGEGRLGPAHRRRVLESRLDATGTLVEAFLRTSDPPGVWYQASATGYYGDRGDEVLTETAGPGDQPSLADLVLRWEAATAPVRERVRLVVGRIGLVIADDAPAWQRFLQPIKAFVGGPLGGGRQWYAWIDADDQARATLHLLENAASSGAYNVTAPEPVRQGELTRAAARRLRRPAFVPTPAVVLRLALGAAADMLLLPSVRAVPARLEAEGFEFLWPDLGTLMAKLYGRPGP